MPKHVEAIKPLDQFIAPWETESGADAEIDKPKLKRYIHGLLVDKAKAQDSRDDAAERVTKLEADLTAARDEAAAANGDEAQKKIDRLAAQLKEAKDQIAKMESDKELADLRAEVLGDLDPKVAKYVKGETREELEKSLEEIKADFGIEDTEGNENEDDEDEDGRGVRTTPRPRLRNVADPQNGKPAEEEYDFDKVAGGIVGAGSPFA